MRTKFTYIVAALVLVAALIVATFGIKPGAVNAAPNAAVTPVSNNRVAAGVERITWFNNTQLTSDTTVCKDTHGYSIATLQWSIDQSTGGPNTTTVTSLWGNIGGTATNATPLESNTTVVSANAADAHGGGQFAIFGNYTCIKVDVANSVAIDVTAVALIQ